MHRIRMALFVLILGTPVVAAAQTEGGGAPTFHPGQWAARFQIANGFYGLGAIHFSTPDKAWLIAGTIGSGYRNNGASDQTENSQGFSAAIGRRWYRPTTSRLRPFGGLGVGGNFSRDHQVAGPNTSTSLAYGGNVYGELGAQIFFAPELSLGAAWTARLGVTRDQEYTNGSLSNHFTELSLTGGTVALEGAFYF